MKATTWIKLGAVLIAMPAAAQVPPAELGQRFVPAPWWMREPVIASMGMVRAEIPANRARFNATFAEVDRNAADATRKAAARVRELDAALRTTGERARLVTTFSTQPLYDQYRNKEGNLQDNARADKIDRYQVQANLHIEVRDVAVLERVYARVLGAKPTFVSQVVFTLEPNNETKTWLAEEAIKDAARRARQASVAAGARLGAVKVIDPSGGVCQTQVLAGWPSYVGGQQPTAVDVPDNIVVTGSRVRSFAAPAPPPPPPPPSNGSDSVSVTLQPPIEQLSAEACVVYALQ